MPTGAGDQWKPYGPAGLREATDGRRLKGGGSLAFPANGGLEEAADSGVDFPVDRQTWGSRGRRRCFSDGRWGLREPRTVAGITSEPADGVSGMWIGMDLGAGLGIQGADFSTDRTDVNDGSITLAPGQRCGGTQGNMGGHSHWPGMWRVPAWSESEWPCSFQEGLDEYGFYILLITNQNHLNREPNESARSSENLWQEDQSGSWFHPAGAGTGTESSVVPTHLVGDLKEFPHISLQRPTTLSQATQPIPSLRQSVLVRSSVTTSWKTTGHSDSLHAGTLHIPGQCGIVPTHLVGDLKEFPHISLQRPTTLSQATQPIPSLRHRFGSGLSVTTQARRYRGKWINKGIYRTRLRWEPGGDERWSIAHSDKIQMA